MSAFYRDLHEVAYLHSDSTFLAFGVTVATKNDVHRPAGKKRTLNHVSNYQAVTKKQRQPHVLRDHPVVDSVPKEKKIGSRNSRQTRLRSQQD